MTARYLKLIALAGFGVDKRTALAELAVITDTPSKKAKAQNITTATKTMNEQPLQMKSFSNHKGTKALIAIFLLCLCAVVVSFGVASEAPARVYVQNDWTEPFPAFRIAGNLYYVGSKGLASYLITTPEGHILINSNLEANVPMIRESIESLGLKFSDVKILLISHAHWDHCAASATIKRLTGAKYMVMDGDVAVVESGGKSDFQYGNDPTTLFAATKVDRVLHDGDEVKLGGATLTARLTPGHTRGCTTWTMKVNDGSKTRDAVIIGSPNVNPGYKLVGNTVYPGMTEDFEKTFRVLKSLPVDYFLGAHGSYFDLEGKYPRLKAGDSTAFIDPAGYKNYVEDREQAFRRELKKQQRSVGKSP